MFSLLREYPHAKSGNNAKILHKFVRITLVKNSRWCQRYQSIQHLRETNLRFKVKSKRKIRLRNRVEIASSRFVPFFFFTSLHKKDEEYYLNGRRLRGG